jgi:hypothetical protein
MRFMIRILIWSLLVGLVLAWLGWTPADLIGRLWGLVAHLPGWLLGFADWAWPYISQGAVIVVPLALIGLLLEMRRRRRRTDQRSPD